MGKWRCILAVLLTAAGVALLPSGCVAYKLDPAKIRDVEYTVTDKEDVPEEFLERIEEAKEEPFELSSPIMTTAALNSLSLVGSMLIFCVGVNLIRPQTFRTANMLPSVVIAVIYALLF